MLGDRSLALSPDRAAASVLVPRPLEIEDPS
jgi:hypothetical protein